MQHSTNKVAFLIVYVSPEKEEIKSLFKVPESYCDSAMKLHVIYQHVNMFLDKHPQIKELVTIENRGRWGKDLLTQGLYCQEAIPLTEEAGCDVIKIDLRPVVPRAKLLSKITEFRIQSELFLKPLPLRSYPQFIGLPFMESNYSQHEGELKIGVLFGDPILQKTQGSLTPISASPISFEHEIHRIIAKTKSKRVTVISRVATMQNLRDMLKEGVTILHISCHGECKDGKNSKLCWERSENGIFGVLNIVTADMLVECIQESGAKLSCVVIMACHSSLIGEHLYKKLDIPLVISIKDTETIENTASEIFSQQFYEKMLSTSYKTCLQDARQMVNKHYKYCCCCGNPQAEGCRGHNQCNKRHFIDCTCPRKDQNFHSLKNCIVQKLGPRIKRIISEKDPNEFMLCCCEQDHFEGNKIIGKLNPIFQDKNIVSGIRDRVIDKNDETEIPTNYYIQTELLNEACQKLIKEKARLMVMVGEPHSGKTCFVRKMANYIMLRVRNGTQSKYGLYIELNLDKYISWIQFELLASPRHIRRSDNSSECTGLANVIEYAKRQALPCFFVLDRCNQLAERNREIFLSLINRDLSAQNFPDSKIIIIGNSTPVFRKIVSSLKERHRNSLYEAHMELRTFEKLSIVMAENQLKNREEWKQVIDLFNKWAPNNIEELRAFKPPREITISSQKLRACLEDKIKERNQAHAKRQKCLQDEFFKSPNFGVKQMLLFRILAVFPEAFGWQPLNLSATSIGVDRMEAKVRYMAAFLGVQSYGMILNKLNSILDYPQKYWKKLILQNLNNQEFAEVLYYFLVFSYDLIGCLMEFAAKDLLLSQEKAFEMSPETNLIQCIRNKQVEQVKILRFYVKSENQNQKKAQIVSTIIKCLSKLPLPLDFRMSKGQEELHRILVTGPFIYRIFQTSTSMDEPLIHEALHSLDLLRSEPRLYLLGMTDLILMLSASRLQAQAVSQIQSRLQTVRNPDDQYPLFLRKITIRGETSQEIKARIELMEIFLDFQKSYFEQVKGGIEEGRPLKKPMDLIVKMVANRSEKNRLDLRQKLRYWFYLSEMYIYQLKTHSYTPSAHQYPEKVRRELYEKSNSIIMLKQQAMISYCTLGFYLLKHGKTKCSSKDYKDILKQLNKLKKQDKLQELEGLIQLQINKLCMGVIKILVSRPLYRREYNRTMSNTARGEEAKSNITQNALIDCRQTLRQPDGWFISGIDNPESNRTALNLSVDILTVQKLEDQLKEDCLVMFLRIDFDGKHVLFEVGKDNEEMRFEAYKMSLEDFKKKFDFRRVRILVVFGANVKEIFSFPTQHVSQPFFQRNGSAPTKVLTSQRSFGLNRGGYLICVQLLYPEAENPKQLKDPRDKKDIEKQFNCQSSVIHNRYCESFLRGFIEGLLSKPHSQHLTCKHVTQAVLAAHHVCLCDLADRTPRDSDISKYIELNRFPGSDQFEVTTFIGQFSGNLKRTYPEELYFTTYGWTENMVKLMRKLSKPGFFNLYEGFNHQCEMLCKEAYYQLKRAGETSVVYVFIKDNKLEDLLAKLKDLNNHVIISYVGNAELGRLSNIIYESIKESKNRVVLGTTKMAIIQGFAEKVHPESSKLPVSFFQVEVNKLGFNILMRREFQKRGDLRKIPPNASEINRFYDHPRHQFERKFLTRNILYEPGEITMQTGYSMTSPKNSGIRIKNKSTKQK